MNTGNNSQPSGNPSGSGSGNPSDSGSGGGNNPRGPGESMIFGKGSSNEDETRKINREIAEMYDTEKKRKRKKNRNSKIASISIPENCESERNLQRENREIGKQNEKKRENETEQRLYSPTFINITDFNAYVDHDVGKIVEDETSYTVCNWTVD